MRKRARPLTKAHSADGAKRCTTQWHCMANITSPLRVRQEFSTVERMLASVRGPLMRQNKAESGTGRGPQNSLEGQHDTIAVWVLLLVHVDLTVDHGHDPVSELSYICVTRPIEACDNTHSFTHFLMNDSLILGTDAGVMLSALRRLAVTGVDERIRTFIAWPYTSTPLKQTKHKRRERKGGVGLTCLEETIYHRVSGRNRTDPAVRIPAWAELRD